MPISTTILDERKDTLPFRSLDEIRYPLEIPMDMLKKENMVRDFERLTLDCLRAGETGPPFELLRILKDALTRAVELRIENPAALDRYATVKSILMLAALPTLPDSDMEDFCARYFLRAIQSSAVEYLEYDPRARFEFRLSLAAISHFGHRQEQEKVGRALQRNEERLGDRQITVANMAQRRPAILANWFRDYDAFFPSFTLRGVLNRTRYLSESGNARYLNEEERRILLKVLEVYDFVRFPTVALNEMGKEVPTEELEPAAEGTAAPLVVSGKALMGDIERELESALEEVQRRTGGQAQKVIRAFYDNLIPPPGVSYDRNLALGSLLSMARSGWLLRALEEPNPVRQRFEEYLKHEGAPQDLETFRLAPASPLSLGKFLKFVLVRRMRMSDQDAAKIAIKIGNLLKQGGKDGYIGMAYFDQASDQFHWKI